jgi:arylsulfatase A-like enzyme
MGWQDTSEPFWKEATALNRRYRTPNIERLADQGMKFTQAYACALCSPSRVSLMTGMNAARHKVTNWTLRYNKSPDPDHTIIQPPAWNLNGMSMVPGVERTYQSIALPELLRKQGYRTIHVGKAHWGAKSTSGEDPRNLGFDINIAGHCAGGPGSYHGQKNFSAAWRHADRIWDVPGLEDYHGKNIYLTEALTVEANKVMQKAVADNKPFYLYMSHYAVHAPWEDDQRFQRKYLDSGLKGLEATYAGMIEGIDKSLGDILSKIRQLGVEDNTIVVFMTDNGCPKNLPRNLPLRGHKITPYEGGTRVPMIIKWPGIVKPGTICNEDYLIIEDIFPTFLEMAGVTDFQESPSKIDGRSIVPMLKGEKGISKGRAIFWHFPHTYDQPAYSSVRKDDWKLIYHHASRNLELFNLKSDIGETNNLAEQNPDKTQKLAQVLSAFLREASGQMPVDKRTGKPVEYPNQLQDGLSAKH